MPAEAAVCIAVFERYFSANCTENTHVYSDVMPAEADVCIALFIGWSTFYEAFFHTCWLDKTKDTSVITKDNTRLEAVKYNLKRCTVIIR